MSEIQWWCLSREEGLQCDVCVDGMRLEHWSEFKYLGCVLNESGTDGEHWKVASGSRAAGVIRSPANARGLQVQCARVLHESMVVLVLIYGSKTMI